MFPEPGHTFFRTASTRPLGWFATICAAVSLLAAPDSPSDRYVTRGGYSANLVRHASDNDVRGAFLAYSAAISHANQIASAPDQLICRSVAEMERALREDHIDILVAPATELFQMPPELLTLPYVVSTAGGQSGVEYLLLVRADAAVDHLADLAGRQLCLVDNPQGLLAGPWLDSILHEAALPSAATFFSDTRLCPKPNLAALPVFFGQADACVISRSSFEVLGELNPQVHRQLRILAASPRLQPIVAAFRHNIDPAIKVSILSAISNIDSTSSGRQLLTLFQVDGMALCGDDALTPTRHLLGLPDSPTDFPSSVSLHFTPATATP